MQNRNRVRNILLVLSMSAILGTATSNAHTRHEPPMRQVMQQLDLSPQQRQDIHLSMRQSKQDRKIFHHDLRSLKQQLNELVRSDDWDPLRVATIIQQKQAIDAQLAVSRAVHRHTIWNTLAEQQQAQFGTLMAQQKQDKQKKRRNPMKQFSRLNLTEDQHAQIKALMADQKSQRQIIQSTLKQFKKQQAELIRSDDFDQQSWLDVYQEMQKTNLDLAVSMAHVRHQIWNTLNNEQQVKLIEMETRRKHKNDKKRKRHQKI